MANFADFYLAGGTALALQIGHRVSVDFDLFSENPIDKSLLDKVKRVFSGKSVIPSVNNPKELTIWVDETKITFLHYPFSRLEELAFSNGVSLIGIREIAATKAYTVGRRGSFKDYVDLYFIIKNGYAPFEEIMKLAEKKYGGDFNSRLFLEQLIYLDDVEDMEIIFLKEPVDKKTVQEFFVSEVEKIKL